MSEFSLPDGRLEEKLGDKAPLYSRAEAIAEANRCIYCVDAPCVAKCPTSIDIPNFIHKITTDNVRGAARTIFEENLLGASCARVCPVEVLCAGDCVYNQWGREPIAIGRLQRYATTGGLAQDPALLSKNTAPSTGKKIALVGSGPASIAAAGHLALDGHRAVIFEKKAIPGGLNTLGIAPYKLKAQDALDEIAMVMGLGDIELRTGVGVVAADAGEGEVSAASLLEEYDAVFIGIGLGPDNYLGITGEDGPDGTGVFGATEMIESIKADPRFDIASMKSVAVLGGGNTAIDIARELAQLGVPDVFMVYRKTAAVMSGYRHEMDGGLKEGVRLLENRQPVAITRSADGKVTGVEVKSTVDGSNGETLPCDAVAFAIGQSRLTELAKAFPGVELDKKGCVLVDEDTARTGNPKVFAGGDCVNGGKEVVNAAEHGKRAAREITRMLNAG
ncbi:MAG: FAD-dependent oxidoreductase [Deltaproteobacteria bacterium]|nr:FAD-dependent oxidoreductase [Deltaproteobacteria bacterium]